MEIVAVLALISLFTHNHLFWIAGLLLALIDLPDFSSPMSSIAQSLEKLSGSRYRRKGGGQSSHRPLMSRAENLMLRAEVSESCLSSFSVRCSQCFPIISSAVTCKDERFGREITLFTMWYELRWGITACLLLTVSLITLIFYYLSFNKERHRYIPYRQHPSRNLRPRCRGVCRRQCEGGSRRSRCFGSTVPNRKPRARRRNAAIDETIAATTVAQTELAAADGLIQQAQGAYQQAFDELATKQALLRRRLLFRFAMSSACKSPRMAGRARSTPPSPTRAP